MFTSILNENAKLSLGPALWCAGLALVLGFALALVYRFCEKRCSRSLFMSLALLPLLVEAVILMVNGQLGTGIAVMGAFSLVRFRSVQGSGREITAIFAAMAIGLACGTGYLTFAAAFAGLVIAVSVIMRFVREPNGSKEKLLRITVPEDLEYDSAFDDLFKQYTKSVELQRVKTTNMGSMYDLKYIVVLKNVREEKKFIDALRCRNGNLPISLGLLQADDAL